MKTANIYQRQMTRLENVFDGSNIQVITIADFCNPQRQYQYAQRIAEIRSYCPDAETKERNKEIVSRLKTSLPAGIVSCIADGLGESDVKVRNGVMAIDIDASKNPAIWDWEAVKRELAKSPYIAYAGLSVSGLGVWALIPVADPSKHFEHFRAICKDFERQFVIMQRGDQEPTVLEGIHLDTAPSNIASKRFVSYDPYPYTNVNAKIYERVEELPRPQRTFFAGTSKAFDVEGWLTAHGISFNARYRHGGIQFIVRCPNAAQHTSGTHKAESAVFLYPDGRPGYKCQHDHCSHIHWPEYRKFYEPQYKSGGSCMQPFARPSLAELQQALISAGVIDSADSKPTPAPPAPSAQAETAPARIVYKPLLPDPCSVIDSLTPQEFDEILSPQSVAVWQEQHPSAPF